MTTLFSLKTMWMGMVLGTCLVMNTSNWPVAWMGFELNLLSFVPIALNHESTKKSAIIYFIAQSLGSLLILIGGLMFDHSTLSVLFILSGLTLKLGMIPMHYWVPPVAVKLKPTFLYILLSWQKIAPIFLMLSLLKKLMFLILTNATCGALLMMISVNVPILLVFSGMVQLAWVLSTNGWLSIYYTSIYFFILMPVILFMQSSSTNFNVSLMNMGGLPPMSGFMIKLKALMSIKNFLGLILLMSSALALSSYTRLLVNSPVKQSNLSPILLVTMMLGLV